MKRLYILLFIITTVLTSIHATDHTPQVSLLTAAPGDMTYELFGHTGIRVRMTGNNPARHIDIVYHYGLFDFSAPHFLYRFVKGETDYSIGAIDYKSFVNSYIWRGSTVYEQTLNLTLEETERLLRALDENMRPENRIYRYNFFYDNCATRPRDKIEEALADNLTYDRSDTTAVTFRELIHRCTAGHPWLTFGIDLALGAPLDHPATYREQMFLPHLLMQAFDDATITTADGEKRALTGTTQSHSGGSRQPVAPTPFTPTMVFYTLLIAVIAVSVWEYRRGKQFRLIDIAICGLYGLFGAVLFFLIFVSTHPATSPNYTALWCHPLLWFVMLSLIAAPHKMITNRLMSIVLLTTIATLIAMPFLPQLFQPAFYPLAAIPGIRALTHLEVEMKNGRL